MIWLAVDRHDGAGERQGSMNRTLAGFAYVTGFLLALMFEANANGVVALERQSPTMRESRELRMAQAQPSEPGKMFRGVGIVTAIESAGSLTINQRSIGSILLRPPTKSSI
jgi:hypothetical protein